MSIARDHHDAVGCPCASPGHNPACRQRPPNQREIRHTEAGADHRSPGHELMRFGKNENLSTIQRDNYGVHGKRGEYSSALLLAAELDEKAAQCMAMRRSHPEGAQGESTVGVGKVLGPVGRRAIVADQEEEGEFRERQLRSVSMRPNLVSAVPQCSMKASGISCMERDKRWPVAYANVPGVVGRKGLGGLPRCQQLDSRPVRKLHVRVADPIGMNTAGLQRGTQSTLRHHGSFQIANGHRNMVEADESRRLRRRRCRADGNQHAES